MLEVNGFYNMDCMEGMKQFPDKFFDWAIVDPPYGGNDAIGIKNGSGHAASRKDYHVFKNEKPEEEYFKELARVSKNQIVWGGNFFGLSGGYICWNKHGTAFGEAELAYCSKIKSVVVFDYIWNGMLQENMKDKEVRIHPTQKPVTLYEWLLSRFATAGDKILDTHVGSASSLVACYNMGFEYVGFEIDPVYYKAASDRLESVKTQMKLF